MIELVNDDQIPDEQRNWERTVLDLRNSIGYLHGTLLRPQSATNILTALLPAATDIASQLAALAVQQMRPE